MDREGIWSPLAYEPVSYCPQQAKHQVSRDARAEDFGVYRRRTQNEAEKIRHHESNQGESWDKKHGRWNQVRPEMIDPPAGNRWNSKHNRDEEDAFAIRHSKNSGQKHQGKKNRYNNISAFDFFDKRKKQKEQRKSNEQFSCRETPESWYS